MKSAVDVVFRDLDFSATLNDTIVRKLEKLNRYTDQILHSRVVLDTPHNHKQKGKQYRALIELDIKGCPIAIAQDNESIHVAIRDAFSSAERKIKEISARQRGNH
ncbi:MAG: 30S ribosomal protein S30 [Flavobacterium sp.]|nr:MAG: 30S ribosomal protein S30 [Flavobacterium sp.]